MSAVDNLRSLLALIPGGESIDQKIDDFTQYIKDAATEGAVAATPQITAAIQPYIIAALALGGGAFLFAVSMNMRLKRLETPRRLTS